MRVTNGIFNLLGSDTERYQPEPDYRHKRASGFALDQQRLASWVGLVALGLPVAMLLGVARGTCFYDSISHFYFSQFLGAILVAALAFIGTFLMAYKGETTWESRLANFAGWCAFGIALFPTTGRGCEEAAFSGRAFVDLNVSSSSVPATVVPAGKLGQFFELFENVELVHFGSAALLFAFLAFYCFYVFTRVIPEEHLEAGELTPTKSRRNAIYVWSGWVIVICMLAMAAKAIAWWIDGEAWPWWNALNLTFWCEAFALWAFGISWMVKGRFWGRFFLDRRDQEAAAAAA